MSIMYQIRLKGHLDPIYEEWFSGFTMTLHPDGETTLSGEVVDQAALYGALLKIRDLGIPLLEFLLFGLFVATMLFVRGLYFTQLHTEVVTKQIFKSRG